MEDMYRCTLGQLVPKFTMSGKPCSLGSLKKLLLCSVCGEVVSNAMIRVKTSELRCSGCVSAQSQDSEFLECQDIRKLVALIDTQVNDAVVRSEESQTRLNRSAGRASVLLSANNADAIEPKARQGSQIEKRNCKGETALHRAAIKGDLNQCRTLIDSTHPVDCTDNAGWTPLHEACSRGFDEVVLLLLRKGADPNRKSVDGDTPLFDAIAAEAPECVRLLIQYGADKTAENRHGELPSDICVDQEMLEILRNCEQEFTTADIQGSALNDSPSIENIPKNYLHAGHMEDMVISWTGFSAVGLGEVTRLSKQLTDAAKRSDSLLPGTVLVLPMSSETSHLVCATDEAGLANRTLSFLRGIACGCKIVTLEWLEKCVKYSYLVNPREFLIKGTIKQPESGGVERRLANPGADGLFNGWQFFLVGRFDTFKRVPLCALLTDLKAKVLPRMPNTSSWKPQYDVSDVAPRGVYILFDDIKGRKEMPSLPSGWPNNVPFKFVGLDWLCNCIEFYKLFPTC